MILGARESGDHQLSRAPKIIKIRRQVFARDDFEKIAHFDSGNPCLFLRHEECGMIE